MLSITVSKMYKIRNQAQSSIADSASRLWPNSDNREGYNSWEEQECIVSRGVLTGYSLCWSKG